jgi:hypothetical protein
MKEEIKKSRVIILGFSIIALLLIALILFLVNQTIKTTNTKPAEASKYSITSADLEEIKSSTTEFFNWFQDGKELNENNLVKLTFTYFPKSFLENEFTAAKDDLFSLYGYGYLTKTEIRTYDERELGAIKNYEIMELQKDTKHKTITAYIRMDRAGAEPNEIAWIEWRDIPGEGWRVNALSFNGNIESLEQPLSIKKY